MKRKLALPVFLLAAVLCAVWSFIEAKQPTPASLRKQLIDALDSADAVFRTEGSETYTLGCEPHRKAARFSFSLLPLQSVAENC